MNLTWKEILGPERVARGKYWTRSLYLVHGCTPIIDDDEPSGCEHCWSAACTHRFANSKNAWQRDIFGGLTLNVPGEGARFNGIIRTMPEYLERPRQEKKPQVYAVWNDLFHKDVPDRFISDALQTFYGCPQHIFLIVTKRPDRARAFFKRGSGRTWTGLSNVVFIVTMETQRRAQQRIIDTLACPFEWKMISIEPMRRAVHLYDAMYSAGIMAMSEEWPIDGIILGGESGRKASPMHPAWVRKVLNDCEDAGVPFFFKQWGEWCPTGPNDNDIVVCRCGETMDLGDRKTMMAHKLDHRPDFTCMYRVGKKKAGREIDGCTSDELPEVKANHGG